MRLCIITEGRNQVVQLAKAMLLIPYQRTFKSAVKAPKGFLLSAATIYLILSQGYRPLLLGAGLPEEWLRKRHHVSFRCA